MLIAHKFRSSVEQENEEPTKNLMMNKKVNLLHQALIIANWISSFNPENIHDCFDDSQIMLPDELKKTESNILEDIKKIKRMQLSPNNVKLNDMVRGHS